MKRAVIDIGSNSVRLMLWADGKTLLKRIQTTRLGAGLSAEGELSAESMHTTCEAVCGFVRQAREWGAESLHAFATAAVRLAKNGDRLCEEIYKACGIRVDIVAGQDEALLAVNGALGERDGAVLDIGGASTELCVRKQREICYCKSVNVGAVSLFKACGGERAALQAHIASRISAFSDCPPVRSLTAVGGTATTLANIALGASSYDPAAIQQSVLSSERIAALTDLLFSLPLEERKRIPGMDIRRADILPGGALLLLEMMTLLGAEQLLPSDRDNMEGYLIVRGLI